MSNEYFDWKQDVDYYTDAVKEDFNKQYPEFNADKDKDSFINYLILRMYNDGVPAEEPVYDEEGNLL